MIDRPLFKFYRSYYDVGRELIDSARLEFYDALISYEFTGIEPNIDKMSREAKLSFIGQKHSIKSQVEGYLNKTEAKDTDTMTSKRPLKQQDTNKPPTLDEVIEFFKSHGYAKSGAEKFWNHYQLAQPKTWCDVGGNSIIPFWKQNAHSKWFEKSEKIQVHKNSSNILR